MSTENKLYTLGFLSGLVIGSAFFKVCMVCTDIVLWCYEDQLCDNESDNEDQEPNNETE